MIRKTLIGALAFLYLPGIISGQIQKPYGIRMVDIPSGEFIMGSRGYGAVEEFDEAPAHLVRISRPFRMSATEITNIQYEQYDPSHRKLRGKAGFSTEDDDAVIFVSYDSRPKRNGNTPAARRALLHSILAPMAYRPNSIRSRSITALQKLFHFKRPSFHRMTGACTICTAMWKSGVWTGTGLIHKTLRQIPRDLQRVCIASHEAAVTIRP